MPAAGAVGDEINAMGEQGLPFAFGKPAASCFFVFSDVGADVIPSWNSAHPFQRPIRGETVRRKTDYLCLRPKRQRISIINRYDSLALKPQVFDSPICVAQYRLSLVRFSLASALREVIDPLGTHCRLNEIEQFAVRLRI